jgi:putative PIN family toxin of toxin-antitoxin system
VLKIVLDTNVLVSSLFNKSSLPARLLNLWEEEEYALVSSIPQIEELERVLCYPRISRYVSSLAAEVILHNIKREALIAVALPLVSYSRDDDDNVILATAIAGGADYLVTGDKRDLLHLENVEGILIVSVRQMLDVLLSSSP